MTSGEDLPIDDIALLQLFKDNLLNSTLSTASGDHSCRCHDDGIT